jgi:hypothetical protein
MESWKGYPSGCQDIGRSHTRIGCLLIWLLVVVSQQAVWVRSALSVEGAAPASRITGGQRLLQAISHSSVRAVLPPPFESNRVGVVKEVA